VGHFSQCLNGSAKRQFMQNVAREMNKWSIKTVAEALF
jgi:hypothetical protein